MHKIYAKQNLIYVASSCLLLLSLWFARFFFFASSSSTILIHSIYSSKSIRDISVAKNVFIVCDLMNMNETYDRSSSSVEERR